MFITIQPHQINDNKALMTAAFKLRKKVFIDQLQWGIPATGDCEIDTYDSLDASYLIWCSSDRQKLYGVVRLMATDGPTLLHDVFHATHGSNPDLMDPRIYEGTRMCIDDDAIAQDFPDLEPGRSMSLLLLALCEAALAHGIKRLVSNFEAPLSRIYRRAGLKYDLHGQAHGYGRKPVYCASFEVSRDVLAKMRATIGVELPVFEAARDFAPLVPATPAQTTPAPRRAAYA